MKSITPLAAAATLVLLAGVCSPVAAETAAPQGVLGLTAQASVEVTRDLLSITFSTSREGSDANAVQAQLKQALDTALAEAKKAVRPGQLEVQTGNFGVYPRAGAPLSSGRQAATGWQGSAEIVVEGKDAVAIGQLVGRITTLTVARVGYRLSREASARVEADVAAQAIARYRARAAEYAKQFGYAGYAIREVNVGSGESGPRPMQMARMATAQSPASGDALALEAGKETVTATVSGTVQMQ